MVAKSHYSNTEFSKAMCPDQDTIAANAAEPNTTSDNKTDAQNASENRESDDCEA